MSDTSPDGHGAITEVAAAALPRVACAFPIEWSVRTDTGLVREQNEDNYIALPELGVYVVADGMGGHNAGVVASELCVEAVRDYFEGRLDITEYLDEEELLREMSAPAQTLSGSMRAANLRIFTRGNSDRRLHGMGTTSVGLRVFGNHVAVAHAGDSRCYLLRNGQFIQITTDHSLANFLKALNRLEEARMAEANMSNVIMRALGLEPEVVVDAQEFPIAAGDRFLLCSDGLSDLVPDARLRDLLLSGDDRETVVEQMMQDALDAGGRDNITVMVIDVLPRPHDGTEEGNESPTDDHPAVDPEFGNTTLLGMNFPPSETARAEQDAQAAYLEEENGRATQDTADNPVIDDTVIPLVGAQDGEDDTAETPPPKDK